MKTTGLVPMSAKPYHAGHDMLVRIAARENDEVHLFVSTSDRSRPGEMSISGSAMQKIWVNFIEPTLPENVIVTYGGSPVGNVYAELEAAEAAGETREVFSIYSDDEDILQYADDKLMEYAPGLFDRGQIVRRGVSRSETVMVSGTRMRELLAAGDVVGFSSFLPPAIRRNANEIVQMLNKAQQPKQPRRLKTKR